MGVQRFFRIFALCNENVLASRQADTMDIDKKALTNCENLTDMGINPDCPLERRLIEK